MDRWRKLLGDAPPWLVICAVAALSALAGFVISVTLAYHNLITTWSSLVTTALGSLIGALVAVIFADIRARREVEAARRRRLRAAALDLELLATAAGAIATHLHVKVYTPITLASFLELRDLLKYRRQITDAVRDLGDFNLLAELSFRLSNARQLVDEFIELNAQQRADWFRHEETRNRGLNVLTLVVAIAKPCLEQLPPVAEPEA